MASKTIMDVVNGGEEARSNEVGLSSSLPCNGYSWVSEDVAKIASVYDSFERIIELRKRVLLSAIRDKGLFVCYPSGEEERVQMELA